MAKISKELLDFKLGDLDVATQTKKRFNYYKMETISDFLPYDCKENTRHTSYGINPLKIGKNARKRLYKELENLEMPRSFEKNDDFVSPELNIAIFQMPLTIATINKLYRAGIKTFQECIEQTALTKQILGPNGYQEVKEYLESAGYELKHKSLDFETKIEHFNLPRRLNVVENEQIKPDHFTWFNGDDYRFINEARQDGIMTINDIVNYGVEKFVNKYGEGICVCLEKCGENLRDFSKSTDVSKQELIELREMVAGLIKLQEQEIDEDDKKVIIEKAKVLVKSF